MAQYMLTTLDNPFDPFTRFDEWREYDEASGYYSLAFLARIVETSDDLSEQDQEVAINDAIDEICRINSLGIYKKVLSRSESSG